MIKRAIIFAAGVGRRLKLNHQHKSLLNINGEILIEKIINNLLVAKINEIIVITGYRHQDFLYLVDKYVQVKLVHNTQYENGSSAYAGYLVKDYLQDNTIIISGDMVMGRNFFMNLTAKSIMCAVKRVTKKIDWVYNIGNNNNIIGYEKSNNMHKLLLGEWSLLDERWAKAIREQLQIKFAENEISQYQMVDILIASALKNKIVITPYILSEDDQWDIDTPEDLEISVAKTIKIS
ncbi:NTP transferase domain-containing protein [Spiroplasma endosymbiont of Eupeodes luniger]|uniref:NTP transferase domain-containing protein n=1 Tax=Spiroplasma endosymbiont of Eupeodes luniger TaxID=3066300 RepID=UPI0030CAF0F8